MNAWSAFWSIPAVSHQALARALVVAVGLAIGRPQWRNIGVGIAGNASSAPTSRSAR